MIDSVVRAFGIQRPKILIGGHGFGQIDNNNNRTGFIQNSRAEIDLT